MAIANVLVFYFSYSSYLKEYLTEKNQSRSEVSIKYINDIIEKQTIEDIDSIFNDSEIQFFELLEDNDGNIPLTEEKNVNIVVNYLIQSGVTAKYIEEIIPVNNFKKLLDFLKDETSAEYSFLKKLFRAILVANLLLILFTGFLLFIFTKKIILPIKKATTHIKQMKPGDKNNIIQYEKNDEIGLLIDSINSLNKKLNVQEGIRNRLLADISHELKTPITSIQCYLEWISDGVIEMNQKNLDSITTEMSRLIELVNTIMQYEEFENKKLVLNTTVQDIPEVIEEIILTHTTRLQENKQTIQLVWNGNLFLDIDVSLFKQLIHNLIGNFLKYAGSKTTLTIKISKSFIDFSDNGKWIEKEKVQFLTEKFYQGKQEKTGKIDKRGIGVGLSIVEKIASSHGWKTKIQSEKEKGFSFRVYF